MSVLIEKNGAVTTITINRPEVRNAVNRETADALAKAFREFEDDKSASVAVLCGAEGNFCAGADLKAVAESSESSNRLKPDGDGPMGPSRMQLTKPVIAAVEGYAVAGGLELALWCDLRVVADNAVFGVFCRRFGVPLIDGGTVRLPRLIGQSRAMDMILTGRPVSADEAQRWGLANRVVKTGCAQSEAEKLAARIAQFPQECLRADRSSSYQQWSMNKTEALTNEFQQGVVIVESGESVAGAGLFSEGQGRHGEF